MPWNIDITGTRDGVKAALVTLNLPGPLAEMVTQICDEPTGPDVFNGIHLKTSGHWDGVQSNVWEFSVMPVPLLLDPPAVGDELPPIAEPLKAS